MTTAGHHGRHAWTTTTTPGHHLRTATRSIYRSDCIFDFIFLCYTSKRQKSHFLYTKNTFYFQQHMKAKYRICLLESVSSCCGIIPPCMHPSMHAPTHPCMHPSQPGAFCTYPVSTTMLHVIVSNIEIDAKLMRRTTKLIILSKQKFVSALHMPFSWLKSVHLKTEKQAL